MDPYHISLLTNTKKCSSKKETKNISLESYTEILRLLKNIDNPDIMKNLCKLILERHCCRQITPHQLDIIIRSIKNIK